MSLITAAISGAVVMALEVVAFRLYAPYFGYSIYVWGSMISVVMLALALGYGFGGRLADRSTTSAPLYTVILGSALYQLVIVFTARPLLAALSGWGDFTGTVIATLVIFAPPMTALAGVGPFVIRLLARAGDVGATAGVVYAVSTGGSMLGVLIASFFLLPQFGTQATLEVLCLATAAIAVAGLAARSRNAERRHRARAFRAAVSGPEILLVHRHHLDHRIGLQPDPCGTPGQAPGAASQLPGLRAHGAGRVVELDRLLLRRFCTGAAAGAGPECHGPGDGRRRIDSGDPAHGARSRH
ncbi:membrane hypothetical protein [Candidatus Sulfopaludibacter sp. SbA4]|nr:membrane hypothetical protein [Candidatus Sulfopaludibacter sp. SbA4]